MGDERGRESFFTSVKCRITGFNGRRVLVLQGMKCKFFCTLIPVLQRKDTAQTPVNFHFLPKSTSTST